MRRSKQNVEYWETRMKSLFELDPDIKLVENRYTTLRLLLQKKYAPIMESVSPDTLLQFLRDTIYLDRELRRETEGLQEEEKTILSQEKMLSLGYSPNYEQDVQQLKML